MAQLTRIAENNTKIIQQKDRCEVWLYNTCIVTVRGDRITLNTGGYRTDTTRDRMNQVANEKGLKYQVSFAQGNFLINHINQEGTRVTVESPKDTYTFTRSV